MGGACLAGNPAKEGDSISMGKDAATIREALDVTVLMGGPSREREVSLQSGQAVADALQAAGHRVTRSDITPDDTRALDRPGIDVVFIALHGEFGESGEVQTLCEQRGLCYTGSPPNASHLGMDKAASKEHFLRAGLRTADWVLVKSADDPASVTTALDALSLPVVVKPLAGGSSVDVALCRTADQRTEAIENLLDVYGLAMVEQFVAGREYTVGILDETPLPVIEVVPQNSFYDYHAKYADDAGTQYIFEHGLDDETIARVQQDALTAHRSLGCRDLSRVDFILDEQGVWQVLEINTIPGFTSHSLVPKAAARMGLDFTTLCDRIVRLARRRQACVSPEDTTEAVPSGR